MCVYPLFGEPFSVTSIKRFPISVKLIIVLTVIFVTPSCNNGRSDLTHTAEIVAKVENEASIKKTIEGEGKEILAKIEAFTKNNFIFALDIDGTELSTVEFEKKIEEVKLNGVSEIIFIIGGSYGLSTEVKKRADFRLSFSKMTFPHQLFRIILLEQIYRAFKIANNEPYHK